MGGVQPGGLEHGVGGHGKRADDGGYPEMLACVCQVISDLRRRKSTLHRTNHDWCTFVHICSKVVYSTLMLLLLDGPLSTCCSSNILTPHH